MSAVFNTAPTGKTQWVERRASRLAVAFSLTQQAAIQEAEKDYWAFRGVGGLCDQCDNGFFCSRPGCVRLAPVALAVPAVPAAAVGPRSCDQLGLCQARTPRCAGCVCAPAEVPDFPSDRQISTWMRWVLVLAAGTSLVALVLLVVRPLP